MKNKNKNKNKYQKQKSGFKGLSVYFQHTENGKLLEKEDKDYRPATQEEVDRTLKQIREYNKALGRTPIHNGYEAEIYYWKTRCRLAEAIVEASPCDPDITTEQIEAHQNYQSFLNNQKS